MSTAHLSCNSPTGIKDTPVVVLLEGHFSVALSKELLCDDCTLLPGPRRPVGVQLGRKGRLLGVEQYTRFNCPSLRVSMLVDIELTTQGSRRSWSATSGQDGLTFQEFPNSSAVDSMMPCRVVKSFSVSPSKLPHRPPTRPRRWAARRTYTRMPAKSTKTE